MALSEKSKINAKRWYPPCAGRLSWLVFLLHHPFYFIKNLRTRF
ncbi:hypothetical protein Cabys_939 [Caldithrix abyssi DSM 13497]|uniref:Uncharacterized protein n=1 Tax=Caldithrix abyssi DSM 13497 TaxID=880073 RepID=A0A1J1C6Q6_CALAY|nr:hypothetical protein Cabys_939 [Caldithrix abyssi DSM 13497]